MKIGIIGIGTVGSGVLKVLNAEKKRLESILKEEIEIKYVCNRSKKEIKSLDAPFIFTQDYNDVVSDPEVDVVVELIGGVEEARDIALKALSSGKHLISANKALFAHYGKEILQKAQENNLNVLYEASVAGAIPILTPLKESLVANTIMSISGILNGTCNYILTRMLEDETEFEQALKEASQKGYAEADPSFDVDGIDTAHKISILTLLSYGMFVNFEDLAIQGIRDIKFLDVKIADSLGYRIKLIASSELKDQHVTISVAPTLVPRSSLLFNINDAYNGVEIESSYAEKSTFIGKGAGELPTASSVVADIMKIKRSASWDYIFDCGRKFSHKTTGRYYIRTQKLLESPLVEKKGIENGYNIYFSKITQLEKIEKLILGDKRSIILHIKD